MRYKVLIISFLLCLPFWWGANVLADSLEDFWFVREMTTNPDILNASMNESISQLKLTELLTEKAREKRLNEIELKAKSAIVVDLSDDGSSKTIFSKNSGEKRVIASLTKLMTALVIFDFKETYNFSETIKIDKDIVDQEGDSKYGNLKIGDSISVEALTYKMLIESNNDAAYALTKPITEKSFVGLMNHLAEGIGLKNTFFANATGLDPDSPRDSANTSTTEDLAVLSEYILNNYPKIFYISSLRNYTVLNQDGSVHHYIGGNTNELLSEYPEIIGGKTGWTPMAQGCLLEIIKKPDGNGFYIAVILGSPDRFNDMRQIISTLMN